MFVNDAIRTERLTKRAECRPRRGGKRDRYPGRAERRWQNNHHQDAEERVRRDGRTRRGTGGRLDTNSWQFFHVNRVSLGKPADTGVDARRLVLVLSRLIDRLSVYKG